MKQAFNVQGMTCQHCEQAVTRALKRIDAGAQVQIDRATGRVQIDSTCGLKQIAEAIEEEGYKVVFDGIGD